MRSRRLPNLNRGGQSPSGPSEDTFSGPAVDNETALRDGSTGAVYTKPIQETLFLVLVCVGSVATALAVLPTNRLRADSKATDHFERGIQDLILALSTCRLERRRSGCVAAMFHQCPQRAFWPPRRAPRARESGCGFGKVTSGSRHQRDISGAKRSVVPSHRGWGRATTLLSVLEVRHGSLDSTPAQD